tara:strand:+ start:2596 stop:3288 length:693 start_codon:yes stop_codon:yes gene_type:complete
MRQIILDTETTGISVESGHRVIEIGMVEIIDRRLTGNDFQAYLNPERKIDPATIPIHGLTDEFISDKPLFKDVASEFLSYIENSEVIMHNAPFDSSFINNEFALTGISKRLEDLCDIVDSLVLAREKHPGQRNSLDALCSRYEVNTSSRELHGALIDAKLLANVYLLMTGGQAGFFGSNNSEKDQDNIQSSAFDFSNRKIIAVKSNKAETKSHDEYLKKLSKFSKKDLNW